MLNQLSPPQSPKLETEFRNETQFRKTAVSRMGSGSFFQNYYFMSYFFSLFFCFLISLIKIYAKVFTPIRKLESLVHRNSLKFPPLSALSSISECPEQYLGINQVIVKVPNHVMHLLPVKSSTRRKI